MYCQVKRETTLLLLWAVGVLARKGGQPGTSITSDDPIDMSENEGNPMRLDTPEVVLQLKYDGGALNRIYLTQFRQGGGVWVPSVLARNNLCSDLCHAGLGGSGCGASCSDLIPVGLQAALHEASDRNSTDQLGEPRTSVCPTLCYNRLGEPLCNCNDHDDITGTSPNWSAICYAFCQSDRYVLGGCPACDSVTAPSKVISDYHRGLSTSDGWSAWCNVQCRQGQGGAACNCDRAPFQ